MNIIKKLFLDKRIIPYLLIQYIAIFIFLNGNLVKLIGLDFKLYAIIFGFCSIVASWHIVNNFRYLWSGWTFRFLFLFFICNILYSLFYSSDFRSSNYIDVWIQGNIGLKHALLQSGYESATREFGSGETKFLKYLAGVVPLFSFVLGYMTFSGIKTINKAKDKLNNVMEFLSIGYLLYIVLIAVCIGIGTTPMVFMDNRLRIGDGFTGNDFDALMLFLFIGFTFCLSKIKCSPLLNHILSANILVLVIFILLGIKKGTIISSLIGLAVIFAGSLFFREKRDQFPENSAATLLVIALLPILLVVPLYLFIEYQDFLGNLVYNITDRFADRTTLDVRTTNWTYYLQNWADNLNWFTVLFGFGTDASRETSFFLSSMQPDKSYAQPHIHNIYLEYFYNWGAVALLYFMPLLLILYKNIKNILKESVNSLVKLFSVISSACILFYLVFFNAESPAMPGNMIFFALIGFLESVKYAFSIPLAHSCQEQRV